MLDDSESKSALVAEVVQNPAIIKKAKTAKLKNSLSFKTEATEEKIKDYHKVINLYYFDPFMRLHSIGKVQ